MSLALAVPAGAAPVVIAGKVSRLEIVASGGAESTVRIRITPSPGWHTYWLNPGNTGLAPTLRWDTEPLAQTLAMSTPEKIVAPNTITYGYRTTSTLR